MPTTSPQAGTRRTGLAAFRDPASVAVRHFARHEIRPRARELDEADGVTPVDIWQRAAQVGITDVMLPTEVGGGGFTDVFTQCLVQEELCFDDPGIGNLLWPNGFLADPVRELGAEERKKRWLGPLVGPRAPITALATTEPGSGSHVASIRTTARPQPAIQGCFRLPPGRRHPRTPRRWADAEDGPARHRLPRSALLRCRGPRGEPARRPLRAVRAGSGHRPTDHTA
ncbi:acyl-CoA dehydrogenase family protein [Streptomyces sp. NA02950]|uniref:acyl-CoA dehydrogenase family protein n=1 Tax=Streptomyces sp. NA02950 TaxID=2742137 RepID=UPI0020CB32D3|nr:acyl-CoA dehydrogenase family protein [Streptomyces sp. NA02950]